MARSSVKAMFGLHTWTGLVLGWVLYFMFVTGTLGYLDTEIDRWMMPELPAVTRPIEANTAVADAVAVLKAEAPAASRWQIRLPNGRNQPYAAVSWRGSAQSAEPGAGPIYLDPETGSSLAVRATGGGQALYRMHWQLHYVSRAVGEWVVGVATLCMFIALITGLVIHRRLLADFFTFRPGKGQRSWLDMHNLSSVLSLPFQLMITYSGLLFMMFVYLPLLIAMWYGPGQDGRSAFFRDAFKRPEVPSAAGETAPVASLSAVYAESVSLLGGASVASIEVHYPGDANALIIVRSSGSGSPLHNSQTLTFHGVSGELLERSDPPSRSKVSRDLMLGLHEGLFAEPLLRAFYLLSGLMGSIMIATGLTLWCRKRERRGLRASGGPLPLHWVERLNAGTVIGLPASIGCYFASNRLLSLDLAGRAAMEMDVLFYSWAVFLFIAAVRPAARVWQEQSLLAAAIYALLPVLNAVTTDRHLPKSLAQGDWVMAGFDVACLGVSLAFLVVAWHQGRYTRQAPKSGLPERVGGRLVSSKRTAPEYGVPTPR